jgi:hypothetical protein
MMTRRWTTLSDGRHVQGSRKTLARRVRGSVPTTSRQRRDQGPPWQISFELPGLLGLGLTQGPIEGIIGARVGPKGHIEISGEKGWVERQAVAVLRKLARSGLVRPLPIVMTRGDEPGPSMSGPLRRGVSGRLDHVRRPGRNAHSRHLLPADRRVRRPPLPQISGPQGGCTLEKAPRKNVEISNYVTSPPRETASDLADFHQRQGRTRRFAGKERETALGRCRVGRYEGRSAGRLRASSQGGGRAKPTPPDKAMTPLKKLRPPLRPPWFFPAMGAAHVHRTVHFSRSFLRSRYT